MAMYCAQKILLAHAEDPRRTYDETARVGRLDRLFACYVALSVNIDWFSFVRLRVDVPRRAPVKNVVGAEVHDLRADCVRGFGHRARPQHVHSLGQLRLS